MLHWSICDRQSEIVSKKQKIYCINVMCVVYYNVNVEICITFSTTINTDFYEFELLTVTSNGVFQSRIIFMKIENFCPNLYRIRVPFEDIYTSVYVVRDHKNTAIIDSGAGAPDVDQCIVPALRTLGIDSTEVRYLLLTHAHGDHAGGAERLSAVLPHAEIRASYPMGLPRFRLFCDNEILMTELQAIFLPGHVDHSVGFLHLPSKTLLSGDCLQLKGIGKYRKNIADREAYERSVRKLQSMNLKRIVAAHEFDPLGSIADGEEAVQVYLEKCLELW